MPRSRPKGYVRMIGREVAFTSSTGGAYTFVYDITAGIPAVIEEITPQGTIVYVREPSGALIARIDTSTSTTHTYHIDALGNTRVLTSGGSITDRCTYDAWGNVIAHDQYTCSID